MPFQAKPVPLRPDAAPAGPATGPDGQAAPRAASGPPRPRRRPVTVGDRFFRDMVASMRNGVLAVTRDGAVAVMNDEAYRIFGLTPEPTWAGPIPRCSASTPTWSG
jgi:PAS domain-containing protein